MLTEATTAKLSISANSNNGALRSTLDGNLLPPKKFRREISRYATPAVACGQASGSDEISLHFPGWEANVHIASELQTPEGISVCTPAANTEDTLIWPPKLPCFEFEDWLQTQCM